MEEEEALSCNVAQSLFDAYLADGARAFYPSHFGSASERIRVTRAATRPLAKDVADAIERQNARFSPSEARTANLARLRASSAVVVTGQQVGLFLGPLFTVYKAASAVVAARALERESGAPVVPVFWLQSEDHDLPEVSSVRVPRSAGEPRVLAVPASADQRVSLEHCVLPEEVSECLTALASELGTLPHAAEHLARLRRHYRPGAGWVDAFAGVLAELFAAEGLVLVDPRDPALAELVRPVHRRVFVEHDAIARALAERAQELLRAGYAETVHLRDDAPLSFFHAGGASSARIRLRKHDGAFHDPLGGRSYRQDEIIATLERDALCVSTSALLRPIVQDTLLPTAAYVGGPAEVSYFGQLAPLYAHFGLPMPLVVPRARLRLIDDKTARLLSRLGLSAPDIAQSEEALLARVSARDATRPGAAQLEDRLAARLCDVLAEELAALGPLAPEVAASADKTRATLQTSAGKLAQKYEKSLLHRDEARVADVRRLRATLFPLGEPQERVLGCSWFVARHGERAFLDGVLASIEPFLAEPREVSLT